MKERDINREKKEVGSVHENRSKGVKRERKSKEGRRTGRKDKEKEALEGISDREKEKIYIGV